MVFGGPRGKSLGPETVFADSVNKAAGSASVGRNNDEARSARLASSEMMIMMMVMGTGVWVPSGWEIYEGARDGHGLA